VEKPILVIGHRNPDTDSICSALGYAYLKQQLGVNAIAARAGSLNPESKYVLNYFKVKPPVLVDDVYPRIGDSKFIDVPTVLPKVNIHNVGELFIKYRLKAIPVVEENGDLAGLVTVNDFAERYFEEFTIDKNDTKKIDYASMLQVLNGKLWTGSTAQDFQGMIYIVACTPEKMNHVQQGDLVVTADREDAQAEALNKGVACLVLSRGFEPSNKILELGKKRGTIIITTPYDTYSTARLILQSVQIRYIMSKNCTRFKTGDYVSDVKETMEKSRESVFPVLRHGKYVGAVDKTSMLKPVKQELILVDHNEQSQAVEGIEDTHVLEIIDHHRLGGLTTAAPVFIRQDPVGCTATIVAKLADHRKVKLTPAIAGLLLSAIISDTLYFKSPTSTDEDKEIAAELAGTAGIKDVKTFALNVLREGSALNSLPPKAIVHGDAKEFDTPAGKVTIAQVTVMDGPGAKPKWPVLKAALQEMVDRKETDTALLMVTDIMAEKTNLLWAGKNKDKLDEAFGKEDGDGSYDLPGVLSRKKQIVPPLTEAFR
jgi:manganese-dependent inorganic pyrophosphatase